MNQRGIEKLARHLRKDLGAHVKYIGKCVASEVYDEARLRAENADQLLRYLVRHLQTDDEARRLCNAVSAPGYINARFSRF